MELFARCCTCAYQAELSSLCESLHMTMNLLVDPCQYTAVIKVFVKQYWCRCLGPHSRKCTIPWILPRNPVFYRVFFRSSSHSERILNPQTILDFPLVDKKLSSRQCVRRTYNFLAENREDLM